MIFSIGSDKKRPLALLKKLRVPELIFKFAQINDKVYAAIFGGAIHAIDLKSFEIKEIRPPAADMSV